MNDPLLIPEVCTACGWPMEEDLQVLIDSCYLTPGYLVRQFRCKQGHSITIVPRETTPLPTITFICDICGRESLAFRENTRRHAGCDAENDRRRRRKYPVRLTGAGEAGCNGNRAP